MRSVWIAALAIMFSPLAASAASDPESGQGRAEDAGRALIGKPGPALVLRTIDGQRIDLAGAYGKKPVYLKFWATWCTPCRAQMPAFEKDYETLGGKMQVVAVNIGFDDSVQAVKDLRQRIGLTMPIVFDDGSVGKALNLRVTPQHVVIGRDGRILYVGHEEDARLHQAFDQALAESPRTVAVTRVAARAPGEADAARALAGAHEAALAPFAGPSADARPRAVVFMSAFCESYLATRAPERARACTQMRQALDQAIRRDQLRAVGVATGVWTTEKDLEAYRRQSGLAMPTVLDASGRLFQAFGVRESPTVFLLDAKGRVARRVAPNDDLAAALQSMKGTRS
jgi:peroxiredoxin